MTVRELWANAQALQARTEVENEKHAEAVHALENARKENDLKQEAVDKAKEELEIQEKRNEESKGIAKAEENLKKKESQASK